jgi:Fur family transcriptional regulator, peroxide stress response regulator
MNRQTLEKHMEFFRARCAERSLALTHQRRAIYRILAESAQHPTPEETFEQVRREIPSISLATIYKNIKVFLNSGLVREISTPGQTMRLDANLDTHHHLICSNCRMIFDISAQTVGPLQLAKPLPRHFRMESYTVNFDGHCAECAPQAQSSI